MKLLAGIVCVLSLLSSDTIGSTRIFPSGQSSTGGAVWPLSNISDSNDATAYSSNYYSSSGVDIALQLNFDNVMRGINQLTLVPRMDGLCFPRAFSVWYDEYGNGIYKQVIGANYSNIMSTSNNGFVVGAWDAPFSAKSIQIRVSGLNNDEYGGYYLQLGEVKVFAGEKSMIPATVRIFPDDASASSVADPSFSPKFAIDEDMVTAFSSSYTQEMTSEWLAVRFPSTQYGISGLELFPRRGGWGFPSSFDIEYYDANSYAWKLIPGQSYKNIITPATSFYCAFFKSPVKTNAIRIVTKVNGKDDYGNYYFQLGGVKVYAEAAEQFSKVPQVYTKIFQSWPAEFLVNANDIWPLSALSPYDDYGTYSSGFQGSTSRAMTLSVNFADAVPMKGVAITPRHENLGFPESYRVNALGIDGYSETWANGTKPMGSGETIIHMFDHVVFSKTLEMYANSGAFSAVEPGKTIFQLESLRPILYEKLALKPYYSDDYNVRNLTSQMINNHDALGGYPDAEILVSGGPGEIFTARYSLGDVYSVGYIRAAITAGARSCNGNPLEIQVSTDSLNWVSVGHDKLCDGQTGGDGFAVLIPVDRDVKYVNVKQIANREPPVCIPCVGYPQYPVISEISVYKK